MRERERGEKEEGKRESWEREPHGYRRPEVGLPWREAPSNPPQMLSSTSSWSDVSARATTREHVVLEPVGDHRVAARMLLACAYIRSARVTREKKKRKKEREKKRKKPSGTEEREIYYVYRICFFLFLSRTTCFLRTTLDTCADTTRSQSFEKK